MSNHKKHYSHDSTNGYAYRSCIHTAKSVQVGDVKIWAAARRELNPEVLGHFDVVSPITESSSDAYYAYTGLLLWFPIRDFHATHPQRLRVHCERLIALARRKCKIVTFCEGSHGRTGLVLATCIGLAEPDVDPIEAVRSRHCHKAVETQEQLECVFAACGRPLPAKYVNAVQRYDGLKIKQPLAPHVKSAIKDFMPNPGKGGYNVTVAHTEPAEEVRSIPVAGVRMLPDKESTLPPVPDWKDVVDVSNRRANQVSEIVVRDDGSDRVIPVGLPQEERAPEPTTSRAAVSVEGGVAPSALPFPKTWARFEKAKFHGATNSRSPTGYLICPLCSQPITVSRNARLVKSKIGWKRVGVRILQPRIRWACHRWCTGTPKPNMLPQAGCAGSPQDCV